MKKKTAKSGKAKRDKKAAIADLPPGKAKDAGKGRPLGDKDLDSVTGGIAGPRVGADRRSMIVQVYPSVEYD